jgi:hypothetical protein
MEKELQTAIAVGKPMTVTVETSNGYVIELQGVLVELSASSLPEFNWGDDMKLRMPMEYEMTIRGIQTWVGIAHDKAVRDITLRHASEWKCPYCGHINPVEARYCGHKDTSVGCGAARPFIYEE